ncbi:MAG TPA: beta-L-arabinofuranosidase domain-containing protein [Thermomicrobiales bacterium]
MTVAQRTQSVVVDTSRSPHARLRPAPVASVTLEDQFWAPRLRINRERTLPSQYRQFWETGRLNNFLRVAGKYDGPFEGRFYNDSDVYKWIEAASWSLATHPDPALSKLVDEVISIVAAAQQPDGYLNTYFSLERADERWTDFDLHEMYCAGHLFQAAIAHHRATGSRRLLEVATRFADHIDATFGPPEEGKRIGTDGHPEVEMALVELARETGVQRYLRLAQFLLDVRGHGHLGDAFGRYGGWYHQDHQPFRELSEIVGHAVRAVYLNAGAADIYAETGDPAIGAALHRLWDNMTKRKMYVSGGLGSRYDGEAFGEDYELPNALAYAETCAAIGSVMWNWRMLLIEGDARYADLIELQLSNAMLAGVSLDGELYFYQNPLADEGHHRRVPWFNTACCPPNVARTLASLSGYLYSVAEHEIWVHLYAASSASLTLPDGQSVSVRQRTNYPWDGDIALEIDGAGTFALRLRIPGWADSADLRINGQPAGVAVQPGTYAEIRRSWQPGDVVQLSLPMPVQRVESHPYVVENVGRVALMRGPLLYCVEQVDNPDADLRDVALPESATFQARHDPNLLGGVTVLTTTALACPLAATWTDSLYRRADQQAEAESPRLIPLTAIPYYAWANREPGRMRVWLPRAQ